MAHVTIAARRPSDAEGSISHRPRPTASLTTVESDIEVTIGARHGRA